MKFLIFSDMFSLESWLIDDEDPKIMPAVYEFFQFLGQSKNHSFICFIFHKKHKKKITFKNGSYIQILPLAFTSHYLRKFFSLFAMYGCGSKICKRERFDVVYGMSIYSIPARMIGNQYSIFSVGRIFGSLVYHVWQQKKYLKLYTRHILQYLEIKKPCQLTICTEDGTEFELATKKLNAVHNLNVLINGINTDLRNSLVSLEAIKSLASTDQIKLISIGRLTKWKRHDLAIQTIYHLRQTHAVNAQLTILGTGNDRKRLQTLIDSLDLNAVVKIKSPIPHKQIPQFLSAFHIGLFLYDASNLGNAFWEMCLSARLIVARSSGKTAQYFEGNRHGLLVDDDPRLIANQIASIINDPRISQLTKNCRDHVASLLPDWNTRIDRELSIIQHELSVRQNLGI